MVQKKKRLSSFPSDIILNSFLDQAYTFKNICYIVNPSLLNAKFLCYFVQLYCFVLWLLNKSHKLSSELSKTIFLSGYALTPTKLILLRFVGAVLIKTSSSSIITSLNPVSFDSQELNSKIVLLGIRIIVETDIVQGGVYCRWLYNKKTVRSWLLFFYLTFFFFSSSCYLEKILLDFGAFICQRRLTLSSRP
jgi:hypothetical protein